MRIAVNTRLLLKDKLEGIGWFTYESMRKITTQHPEHEFIFIFDRPYSPEFIFSDNIIPVVIPPPSRHPVLWYIWFEWSVPYILRKHKPDVFLSTDGYLSLSTNVLSIPVIHDINFEHNPQDFPPLFLKYYKHYFPKYAQKASKIVTVSEFNKNDIVKTYHIDPSKIDVVYNGANEDYHPLTPAEKSAVKEKYTHGHDYFLFVGSLHSRKNIVNLIKSFDRFKTLEPSPVRLIIAGNKKWWSEEMESTYSASPYRDEIIFTGRLPTEELLKLTGAAYALTFVPYFEGFGIPLIEAMRCDIPVITSNVTAMPEVAGNAALYADPFSIDSIADAMRKLYKDESLRNSLIANGRIQREKFSWQRTADGLWRCIERTASGITMDRRL